MKIVNQKNFIVENPFIPVEIEFDNKIIEISSFSISRGAQTGKAMYCIEKTEDNLKIIFKTCTWFKVFCIGLIIFGLIIMLLPVISGKLHWDGIGSMMLIAFLFSISGLFMLIKKSTKSIFDLHSKEFKFGVSLFNKGYSIQLLSIIGLQLIESFENVRSIEDDYNIGKMKFYELNLVFENLERMNLMKMTDQYATKNIADELVDFLQKPLWSVKIIRKKT